MTHITVALQYPSRCKKTSELPLQSSLDGLASQVKETDGRSVTLPLNRADPVERLRHHTQKIADWVVKTQSNVASLRISLNSP